MAHVTIVPATANTEPGTSDPRDQEVVVIARSATCASWIAGKTGTFRVVRRGDDAVASAGYVCHPEAESMEQTLSQLLASFDESRIAELKRTLVGQYVLLVKKAGTLYLFTDFIGGRNLFYSDHQPIVSSSLRQAETLEGTRPEDLDAHKALEFLAMKEVLYAAWLGRGTCHRRIKWLMPYEYLVVDTETGALSVRSIVHRIDNEKLTDCAALADDLVANLTTNLVRREFANAVVGATLTGGHDTRLVAGIAANHYPNIRFRIAFSPDAPRTVKDLAVATKVARVRRVPLDVYRFGPGHEEQFRDLTEGLAPCFNKTITPLVDKAAGYPLGLGGVFGTELFMPVPWRSIDEFVHDSVQKATRAITADTSFWDAFQNALRGELQELKRHYQLARDDESDAIRLFFLFDTARYGSFILSAYNRSGYQLDPYGTCNVFKQAFRVSPKLWGNHRTLAGNSLVQKAAMARVNPDMGRVLTYMHYRPMLPLSIGTLPSYLTGYQFQTALWVKGKLSGTKGTTVHTAFPSGVYSSDGWESFFVERLRQGYGLKAVSQSSDVAS